MAVQAKLTELPPLCGVEGCGRFRQQIYFHVNGKKPYLKTCSKHDYRHLEQAKSGKA
jgi:hypothetical protein